MIWLQAEDDIYYLEDKGRNELISDELAKEGFHLGNMTGKKIITVFTKEEAEDLFRDPAAVALSPAHPRTLLGNSGAEAFFSVLELPNAGGVLTTSDLLLGITPEQKLKDKIGLKVFKSELTFDDMAGADELKKITFELLESKNLGFDFKGILLVGIPGTGKSLFAKCLGGELDRTIVELNLARLSYADNPIKAFQDVIQFLEERGGQYILWLDEIEKMFDDSPISFHLLNAFLTMQNELGRTINLDAIVVATANRIDKIMENNPETFRSGRFNLRCFMNFPLKASATDVFNLWVKKINNSLEERYYLGLKRLVLGSVNEQSPFRAALLENKSTALKIFEEIKNTETEINTSRFDRRFIEQCAPQVEIPDNWFNDFEINIDVALLVNIINDHNFSSDAERATSNFPYVHSEIEDICNQIFMYNARNKIVVKEETRRAVHDKLAEFITTNNRPLGESSKTAVSKMTGAKEFFITIE